MHVRASTSDTSTHRHRRSGPLRLTRSAGRHRTTSAHQQRPPPRRQALQRPRLCARAASAMPRSTGTPIALMARARSSRGLTSCCRRAARFPERSRMPSAERRLRNVFVAITDAFGNFVGGGTTERHSERVCTTCAVPAGVLLRERLGVNHPGFLHQNYNNLPCTLTGLSFDGRHPVHGFRQCHDRRH